MDDKRFSKKFTLLDLPSATTILFILIITIFCGMFTWLAIPLLIISLRLYLTFPERYIKSGKMSPLSDIHPEMIEYITELAEKFGFSVLPQFLYTEQPDIPLQVFGTFRRHYVVFNKIEIEEAKKKAEGLNTFDIPILHELSHLKNGDHWKLQFTQILAKIFFVFIVIIAFSSIFLSDLIIYDSQQGGILAQSSNVFHIIFAPIQLGLMYYLLLIMKDIREHYADNLVFQKGVDKGDIIAALQRTAPVGNTVQTSNLFTRLTRWNLGLPSAPRNRMESLIVEGPFFHRTMRWVVFAGGLAIGSLRSAAGKMMYEVTIFGGAVLIVAYLLPYLITKDTNWRLLLKQIIIVVSLFVAGIISFIAVWSVSLFIIQTIYGIYKPSIYTELKGSFNLSGGVLVFSILLTLATVIAAPLMRGYLRILSTNMPHRLKFLVFIIPPVALVVATFSVVVAGLAWSMNYISAGSGQMAGAFLLLIVVTVLYLGVVILIELPVLSNYLQKRIGVNR